MTENILSDNARAPTSGARRTRYVPIAVFLVLAVFFGIGLTMNPRDIPSPLIGKSVPEFDLPAVKGRKLGLSAANLRDEVSIVNVFASWCQACREEHPVLMQLAASGEVPVHGLNYKDKPDDADRWLDEFGDPYTRTGADINGRVGIEWGVYGVPETFIVDKHGIIAYKQTGPVTPQALNNKLLPMIRRLKAQA